MKPVAKRILSLLIIVSVNAYCLINITNQIELTTQIGFNQPNKRRTRINYKKHSSWDHKLYSYVLKVFQANLHLTLSAYHIIQENDTNYYKDKPLSSTIASMYKSCVAYSFGILW